MGLIELQLCNAEDQLFMPLQVNPGSVWLTIKAQLTLSPYLLRSPRRAINPLGTGTLSSNEKIIIRCMPKTLVSCIIIRSSCNFVVVTLTWILLFTCYRGVIAADAF